jgi:hypothetical protein
VIRTEAKLESRFPAIIAGAEANASVAVDRTCERIDERAREHSRVASGMMRDGWQHQMVGQFEGIVFNLVEWTVYNEYGTINMPAQPMMQPAIEESRDEFVDELAAGYEGRAVL